MLTFALKTNLAILLKGRRLFLTGRLVNRKLAFKDEYGEPVVMGEQEFYSAYERKDLEVEADQPLLGHVPTVRNAAPDLSCFPNTHSAEALRRMAYLDELLKEGDGILPPNAQMLVSIQAIAERRQDEKRAPSPTTLRRWARRYLRGKCVVRLVPGHLQKGRTHVISGPLQDLLDEALQTTYLKAERPTIGQFYRNFAHKIKGENASRLLSEQLVIPSEMTVRRYISRLDPYLVDCARLGKHAADKKHRDATGKLTITQILDRWEIDHTPMDLLIVDPVTGKVIGRPYITVVIDRRSRMVMAFLIHLMAPTTESVLRAIERAIRPKAAWLELYPDVQNDWPARGLPLILVPDNATEFHAGDLLAAFNELGIEILYPRSRGPEMKGAVERFFRTLNVGLLHRLPGTTFSNPRERGDYPSEEQACLSLPELEVAVLKWVVDVYHQTPHRGLYGKTPAEVWREGEIDRTPRLPNDLDSLEAILAHRRVVRVHHYGIEVDGQQYHSAELGELGRSLGTQPKVDVRYRDELGHIWVHVPNRNVFIQVPNKDKRMVGLSRDLYQAARTQVREAKGNVNDQSQVLASYTKIMGDADAAKKSNKLRQRRYSAATKLDPNGQQRPNVMAPTPQPGSATSSEYQPPSDLPQFVIRPRSA